MTDIEILRFVRQHFEIRMTKGKPHVLVANCNIDRVNGNVGIVNGDVNRINGKYRGVGGEIFGRGAS